MENIKTCDGKGGGGGGGGGGGRRQPLGKWGGGKLNDDVTDLKCLRSL